ncbi:MULTISPECIES: lipopolysaccharide core heptose(II)-phosphate phosphatase PmrG [Pseudomonas]|uniref:lipopolysaccharide core heptose(II)-phosphate phosphatase PmrG n=1 Tax=Pseudomonas TaxID=286 RepID=UPI0015958127|nr:MULTISPECIES: histidine phosphatase family protein [unclassified Pseudomonas]MCV2230757.1 histidine phosphatase family protein [Pseudomonas sp. AU10]
MVNDVVDLTLTKPRSRRGYFKKMQKWWAGLAVIALLLTAFLMWPSSPRDLGVGNRLLTSQVLPAWRDGDLIVLVRHEERCDRSTNPCFGSPEGLTVLGTQRAQELGKAFTKLGMGYSDVLASPALRTVQTSQFMFGKAADLTTSEKAICGKDMGEELLSHKQPARNLVFVTHSGCIADFETTLGFPRAAFPQYGSALFIRVKANGKFETLGIMNSQAWAAVLKKL